ncbi:MAG: preprotein translocase subunit YajC [Micromonosporaceae bacterium]
MGNMYLAATSNSSGSPLPLILILVVIFGIFYFLMIRPQRTRQRRVMEVQDSVVPGQRVRTTAGMYGTVTAVEDGDIVLEVAPGVEIRYLKRAIMDVLSEAPDGYHGDGSAMGEEEPMEDSAVEEREAEAGHAPDGQTAEKQ